MSLYESFDFFGGGIGVAKIAFSLERLSYGQIFLTKFGGTFFFPVSFFLRSGRKLHRKKTCRNSVNENSSKVRRNIARTLEKRSKT